MTHQRGVLILQITNKTSWKLPVSRLEELAMQRKVAQNTRRPACLQIFFFCCRRKRRQPRLHVPVTSCLLLHWNTKRKENKAKLFSAHTKTTTCSVFENSKVSKSVLINPRTKGFFTFDSTCHCRGLQAGMPGSIYSSQNLMPLLQVTFSTQLTASWPPYWQNAVNGSMFKREQEND